MGGSGGSIGVQALCTGSTLFECSVPDQRVVARGSQKKANSTGAPSNPIPLVKRSSVFRCSLPKAMSISRSEIFRKKEKKDQKMKKVMEDHRSSMGIQWKVMGGPWFFFGGNQISEF